jgi:hypothetical protein
MLRVDAVTVATLTETSKNQFTRASDWVFILIEVTNMAQALAELGLYRHSSHTVRADAPLTSFTAPHTNRFWINTVQTRIAKHFSLFLYVD